MNRNIESKQDLTPQVDLPRSIFDMGHGHKTSFNVGDLIPIDWVEILPGDTVSCTTSTVARLQTLLTPLMDDMVLETFWFFTPLYVLWNHTKEFFGENSTSPWVQQTTYNVPKINSPSGGWSVGTIADYLGIPPNVDFNATNGLQPIALPFRCYAAICNEWFRNQNVTDPLNIPVGDSTQTGSNGTNYINDVANGGMPFKAAKLHDYFTDCLPDPEKAISPVTFPLISGTNAPVYSGSDHTKASTSVIHFKHPSYAGQTSHWYPLAEYIPSTTTDGKSGVMQLVPAAGTGVTNTHDIYPTNLWADLTSSVGSVTINQLRLAFQMQKFYEKQAMAGSRYREIVREMFGTTVPDYRMFIPEYLGGSRIPISIHQIANTSQDSSSSSYLGDLGAMSNTSDINDDFVKSFSCHGILMCCAVVRYPHTYSQGLHRSWTRSTYFDYYYPVLSCIGNQPVFKYQIDATVRSGEDRKAVFGYQEAWEDYRQLPSRCSSSMRPQVTGSLASWHLADNYAAMPSLSDGWMREDKAPVDRALAVTSSVANQVFADFWFDMKITRVMPKHSIPGLIDHF